ncbi:hypothetical protein ABAC460_08165 [Asticcacaulis sp. AC460]|uniref:hypothetical protein n=1 Tax=Asticcacaulis sp. AC460 TaxID=1282360 RepID=UPI0003C3E9E3|nr:hypothetical protein [Asticcacaulis sp. AC460]ESQ90795.1 hypothetical protein ABAC460_08165 [Asticcacaulis sp. AC460]
MFSWPNTPAYTLTSIFLWVVFLAAVFGLHYGRAAGWPEPALWLLALTPAATVLIQTLYAYNHIARQDEFIRAITAKRIIVATGLTIMAVVAWSCVGIFAPLPDVPMWLVYPLFWAVFGMVTPLVKGGAVS